MSYERYGIRVPAVVVSPYARPECVLSDVFDHTSVLKLVGNNAEPLMLLWRQQGFSVVADELPAFLNPPPLPGPGVKWGIWVAPD